MDFTTTMGAAAAATKPSNGGRDGQTRQSGAARLIRRCAWLLLMSIASWPVLGQPAQTEPIVRLADLEIDPAQLTAFKAAAQANAQATLRAEPGVLAFHAVSEKERPHRIRVFEMYADAAAYSAHLQTPHFRKFRDDTAAMTRSRTLLETVPVRLGAKPRLSGNPQVRVAELEIDPAQLGAYKAAVTKEIDASIRLEPGVLAIYAVALKDQPNALRFFEIYADENAYRSHIESPHFKKYVEVTKPMITARRLFKTETLTLGLPTPKSPAYYISEFELTDPAGIRPYSAAVESTFLPFGGRYTVRAGKVVSLEGDATRRIVMIAFPSLEQAQAWYDSPACESIFGGSCVPLPNRK